MKISTIVGARPQFIKAAMVSRAIRATSGVTETLVHTGQHYDKNLSRIFFEELEIPEPDFDLNIGSATHGAQTGRMLEAIEQTLLEMTPDMVVVYGDTNSTLAGALAASKLHIPVAHVEAGMRSFNRQMPEEVNRILTDHLSQLLFAPTDTAVANLQREGCGPDDIFLVGDVMHDAAIHFAAQAAGKEQILDRFGLQKGEYILLTVHRAENTDNAERLAAIVEGLRPFARQLQIVMPLHPRTRKLLERYELLEATSQLATVIDPVGYLDMINLQRNAELIITDSGGVQKEAYFHKVPCVTVRDETEWVELVEGGYNRVVSPQSAAAVAEGIHAALGAETTWSDHDRLYGGGNASMTIAKTIAEYLSAST